MPLLNLKFYWKPKINLSIYSNLIRKYSNDNKIPEVEVTFSNNRSLTISTGKYARFANGCSVVNIGETSVMVTAVAKDKPTNSSFLPLVVDYRQKSAAAGRIPTNFLRRELGPSEKEILCARLIDRSLRPMFCLDYRNETQIVCNLLAIDSMNLPDVQAINAASAAISLSDIPWNGPVGAVRMGMCDNELIVNPTRKELQLSTLDLIVTATKQNLVVMIEGKGNIILLQDLLKAIKQGTKEAQLIIAGIEKIQKLYGKTKKHIEASSQLTDEVKDAVKLLSVMRLKEIFRDYSHDKISRDVAVNKIRMDTLDKVWTNFPESDRILIGDHFNKLSKHTFRELVFEDNRRCDGRYFDDIRNITCQVDLHKPLHGSSLFQRGQTQVFCTISLDSQESAMKLDTLTSLDSGVKSKNFMLHYEFPPYATGEVGRIGPLGRRELGHGALAEKGLLPVLPQDYPFTIRLTSEVLESNGSSSMASVCGGSMALMDAGVPLSSAAAGVAIGLITKCEENDSKHLEDYRILTDLLGIEDYMGDMDMKVAGTKKGITAIQADIKLPGIPLKVVMESLQKATDAKSKILDTMNACIDGTKKIKKDCWPVSDRLTIEPHQRSRIVGPGGINLKKIYIETGVQLSPDGDTSYNIFAPSQSAMDEAKEYIEQLIMIDKVPNLEFGGIYNAKIVEIKETGVMVTLYPSMSPALLHNSQLDQRKIAHPSVLGLEIGTEIKVKYFGRDPVSGFMRLSRKVLQGYSVVKNLDKTVKQPDS